MSVDQDVIREAERRGASNALQRFADIYDEGHSVGVLRDHVVRTARNLANRFEQGDEEVAR